MTEERKVVRSCGECTACCKTHYIQELQKLPGVWCKHCSVGIGCKIYDQRPTECREYACEWLRGSGLESERPDKTGTIIDTMISDDKREALIRIVEVSENAIERLRVRQMAEYFLSSGVPVYFVPLHGSGNIELPWGFKPGPILKKIIESR